MKTSFHDLQTLLLILLPRVLSILLNMMLPVLAIVPYLALVVD
jgi:hypothetical protein